MRRMYFVKFQDTVGAQGGPAHGIECWVHGGTLQTAAADATKAAQAAGFAVGEPTETLERYAGPHYEKALNRDLLLLVDGHPAAEEHAQDLGRVW